MKEQSEEDTVEVERIMRNGDEERKQRDMIPIGIGQHTRIRKAIVDKNARIGKNVMVFYNNYRRINTYIYTIIFYRESMNE